MTEPPYRGSCLCGSVRFEVTSAIESVSHCHCSKCRKAHGAAFATYGSVRREAFRFTSGEASLRDYRSSKSVTRTFCPACGSPLTWRSDDEFADWISFPLGALDTPYIPPGQRHIHVASRAPWYAITDRWPQSERY